MARWRKQSALMRVWMAVLLSCGLLLSVGLLATTAEAAPSEGRIALVVGNAAYRHLPGLPNAYNDAVDVSGQLRQLGFDVVALLDANHSQMTQGINRLMDKVAHAADGEREVVVLFYYAGHGMQVEGSNYLLPTDFKINKESIDQQAINLAKLNIQIKLLADVIRFSIIILDACRDNPLNIKGGEGWAKVQNPLLPRRRNDNKATGTLYLFGTAPGAVAEDGQGRNGLFTTHLLAQMAEPDLSLIELYKNVAANVSQASMGKQVPFQGGAFSGEFCFAEENGCGRSQHIPWWLMALVGLSASCLLALSWQYVRYRRRTRWVEGIDIRKMLADDRDALKQLIATSKFAKGQVRGYLKDLHSQRLLRLLDDGDTVLIGRNAAQVDIVIDRPQVSGCHLQMGWDSEKGKMWLQDQGSTNGTWFGPKQRVSADKRVYIESGRVFYLADQGSPLVFIAHIE
jgi:hypothetical protein